MWKVSILWIFTILWRACSVHLFIRMHGKTLEPLNEFQSNLILENFTKNCHTNVHLDRTTTLYNDLHVFLSMQVSTLLRQTAGELNYLELPRMAEESNYILGFIFPSNKTIYQSTHSHITVHNWVYWSYNVATCFSSWSLQGLKILWTSYIKVGLYMR
jgi:hypothetical protein